MGCDRRLQLTSIGQAQVYTHSHRHILSPTPKTWHTIHTVPAMYCILLLSTSQDLCDYLLVFLHYSHGYHFELEWKLPLQHTQRCEIQNWEVQDRQVLIYSSVHVSREVQPVLTDPTFSIPLAALEAANLAECGINSTSRNWIVSERHKIFQLFRLEIELWELGYSCLLGKKKLLSFKSWEFKTNCTRKDLIYLLRISSLA